MCTMAGSLITFGSFEHENVAQKIDRLTDIRWYRVIQNFASPSRVEIRQASAKLTISPSNTFNLKWENQILDSETYYNC